MASNRRWRLPFRCRGSRRESAVAQLSTLGGYTIMKRYIIILAMLTVVSSIAFAAQWLVDQKIAPPIALPDAYRLATTSLGSATNQFHCTAAEFVGEYCAPGSWRFSFYSTNGALKTVWTCPDGSTHSQDGPVSIY